MPAKSIAIRDAQTNLAALVALAASGTEIILTEGSTPVARIVSANGVSQPRVAGPHRGAISASEDFDEPLSDQFWLGES
ncbi:MAG TPA: type II toxin-antitoxin system prevent-host-death family antitoxin [Pirellulales bacterium]